MFGAGRYGKECYNKYHSNIEFIGFIDNDYSKSNKLFCDVKIYGYPDFLTHFDAQNERIIITSDSVIEMSIQLMNDNLYDYVEWCFCNDELQTVDKCSNFSINSQCGEEIGLRSYFMSYGNLYRGVYVDVGAYHPFIFSNTKWAYDLGWRGVNIDPNIDSIKLFNRYRPDDNNINYGVSDIRGVLDYYVCNTSGRNTIEAKELDFNEELKEVRKVEVRPLNMILEELGIEKIDFIDIDAEGEDEKIVMTFNWEKYNPKCALIELLGMRSIEDVIKSPIHKKMKEEGYILKSYYTVTALYIKS